MISVVIPLYNKVAAIAFTLRGIRPDSARRDGTWLCSGVFAFDDFKARSAAMVVMMDDENLFSIRYQQHQRKS